MTIWMQTRSGRAFDLIDPAPGDVDFREIADVLGNINRFCGHTDRPVSVALHTLTVMDIAGRESPLAMAWALLHDAHEAYIGDITTPVSKAIRYHAPTDGDPLPFCAAEGIRQLKHRVDYAIIAASGLRWRDPNYPDGNVAAIVKRADDIAMMMERRDFMARPRREWNADLEALKLPRARIVWRPGPEAAEELYRRFVSHLPALWPGHAPKQRRPA